jgi:plasmid stability protein
MKQLLLRVPEELHQRLSARAARDGRSINALATEILDAAADADQGDRRHRLRARAAAAGLLHQVPAPGISSEQRQRILDTTRGLGAIADQLIAHERDRL